VALSADPKQALLKDAVLRAFQASEIVGSRAIVTHAKDESARAS
jgi:hypothetical protein